VNEMIQVDQGSQRERDLDRDPALERPPAGAKLSRSEAEDLEWFFGVAPSQLERSTSGGIFDRIENMSPHEIMKAGFQFGRTGTEKVLGSNGAVIGTRSALSARPTAEYRNAGGFEPDDTNMRRFARVSRSVLRLAEGGSSEEGITYEVSKERRAAGEMHVAVFKTYFGDVGNVWEQLSINGGLYEVAVDNSGNALKDERGQTLLRKATTPNAGHRVHGRIVSLYAITRGGKLLLEYSAKLARKRGEPWYDFGDQVRLQLELRGATKLNGEQKALLARAQREARALFVSACFAWNRVRAGEQDK
jgi:hypothetical protein